MAILVASGCGSASESAVVDTPIVATFSIDGAEFPTPEPPRDTDAEEPASDSKRTVEPFVPAPAPPTPTPPPATPTAAPQPAPTAGPLVTEADDLAAADTPEAIAEDAVPDALALTDDEPRNKLERSNAAVTDAVPGEETAAERLLRWHTRGQRVIEPVDDVRCDVCEEPTAD